MRAFIAINFDTPTKEKLLAVQRKLKSAATGSFSRPENLHLTVLFLGEIEDASAVKRAIDLYFNRPVELRFDQIGTFRGNLYWIGIKPNAVLNELYENLAAELSMAGFKTEKNDRFSPHITLAREVKLVQKPDLSFEGFSMTANRVSLMKSERVDGKLIYTEIYGKSVQTA